MKKNLLLPLFVLYFGFGSIAQNLSYYHADELGWFKESVEFRKNDIHAAKYRLDSIYFGQDCGGFREHKRLFFYDDEGFLIESVQYGLGHSFNLIPTERVSYSYDSNGNIHSFLTEKMIYDGSWEPLYAGTFTFDENNNCLSSEDRVWDAETAIYVNENRVEYVYDDQNQMIRKRLGRWQADEGAWDYFAEYESYWSDGLLQVLVQVRWEESTGEWVEVAKEEYVYDENDELVETVNKHWDDTTNNWQIKTKITRRIFDDVVIKRLFWWDSTDEAWSTDQSEFIHYLLDFSSRDELLVPFWYTEEHAVGALEYDSDFNGQMFMDFYYFSSLEVDDIMKNEGIRVNTFPNPCANYISFNVPDIIGKMQLEIYNISGQTLISDQIMSGEKVDVGNLESGVYFYELRIGETEMKGKLVKE